MPLVGVSFRATFTHGCSHSVLAGEAASSSGGWQHPCQRAVLGTFNSLAEMYQQRAERENRAPSLTTKIKKSFTSGNTEGDDQIISTAASL